MLFLYTKWTLLKSVAPSTFFRTPCSGCNNLSLLESFNPTMTKTTAKDTLFGHHPTMWYDVIPPFTENVNKRWKISLSHSTAELGCSVKDINSQKIFLFLRNWAYRNNGHVLLKERESLYRWRFGCRRYRGKLIHHFILVFSFYIFPLAHPAVRISSLLFFKFDTGDFCDPGLSKICWPHWFVAEVLPTACFHSRDQHLCKFIGTKESVCIRKEFNSQRIGLGHQHGRRFIVLGHQYGRRDVI